MRKNETKPRHWPDCRCILCLNFHATCPRCSREFTTYPSFRAHEAAHVRADKKEKDLSRSQQQILGRRTVVVPNGLGYLEKVVIRKDGLAAYNLGVISRFAAALNDGRKVKKGFNKGHKLVLQSLQKEKPPLSLLKVEIPPDQALSIYQLALAANAYPGDVAALLVSYGLEKLAHELRATGSAPPVGTPNVEVRRAPKRSTPHNDFLRENYPDIAPPQRVVEIVEYRQPTITHASIPRSFPTREDESEGTL